MADKSINELPVSQGMTDDALLVVYQNSETESIEGRLIKGYARDAVKEYVDGAAKSAKDAAGSATEAKKSETVSKENADKTAADVLVVKSAADAERERVSAEELRKTAETSRETDEGKRATAEEERKSSETTRREAEGGRESAESERVGNETARGTAEERRADSETQRVLDETGRGTAETTRQEEEGKRATAETNRAEEEAKRAEAEATRATEEGKRATAETGRETSEEGRETAETDRTEAEGLRVASSAAMSVWESYDPAKTYQPLNKVSYNGSSYVCTAESTGNVPTNATYWQLIAAKGRDGEGAGDMLAADYDPTGKKRDVFAYADEVGRAVIATAATDATTKAGQAEVKAKAASVPKERKVNNKPLASDVMLTARDVGALPTTGGTMTGPLMLTEIGVMGESGFMPITGMNETQQAFNFNSERIANITAPIFPTDAANKQYVDERGASASGVAAGSGTAYTLAQPAFILKDGVQVRFRLHVASGAQATLNVNGTGAKRLKTIDGKDMPAGLVVGMWLTAIYSSVTGFFILPGSGGGTQFKFGKGKGQVNGMEWLIMGHLSTDYGR